MPKVGLLSECIFNHKFRGFGWSSTCFHLHVFSSLLGNVTLYGCRACFHKSFSLFVCPFLTKIVLKKMKKIVSLYF